MNTELSPPHRRRREDRGASLVEYALLVALIAVVCIAAVTQFGGNASDKMDEAGGGIGDTASPTTAAPTGCASVHADGYAAGPGFAWDCYSPTAGPYNLP